MGVSVAPRVFVAVSLVLDPLDFLLGLVWVLLSKIAQGQSTLGEVQMGGASGCAG